MLLLTDTESDELLAGRLLALLADAHVVVEFIGEAQLALALGYGRHVPQSLFWKNLVPNWHVDTSVIEFETKSLRKNLSRKCHREKLLLWT